MLKPIPYALLELKFLGRINLASEARGINCPSSHSQKKKEIVHPIFFFRLQSLVLTGVNQEKKIAMQ